MFHVVRNSSTPLGDQLVEEVTRLIESGRLPEGSRLPSVRRVARRAGVSTYTVTQARRGSLRPDRVPAISSRGCVDCRCPLRWSLAPLSTWIRCSDSHAMFWNKTMWSCRRAPGFFRPHGLRMPSRRLSFPSYVGVGLEPSRRRRKGISSCGCYSPSACVPRTFRSPLVILC